MATIIYPDGREQSFSPQDGETFHVEELKDVIGGYLEVVSLFDGRLMLLDEDGKRKQAPLNEVATDMASEVLQPFDYVVGTVVIVSRKEFS
jgi:hypothetical protein